MTNGNASSVIREMPTASEMPSQIRHNPRQATRDQTYSYTDLPKWCRPQVMVPAGTHSGQRRTLRWKAFVSYSIRCCTGAVSWEVTCLSKD